MLQPSDVSQWRCIVFVVCGARPVTNKEAGVLSPYLDGCNDGDYIQIPVKVELDFRALVFTAGRRRQSREMISVIWHGSAGDNLLTLRITSLTNQQTLQQ